MTTLKMLLFSTIVIFIVALFYLLNSPPREIHSGPLKMDITRAAWVSTCDNGGFQFFVTTLEVFNRRGEQNKSKIINLDCKHQIKNHYLVGSAEGRFVVEDSNTRIWIFSGMLPALHVFNPEISQGAVLIKSLKNNGLWIHQAAIAGHRLMFSFSRGDKPEDFIANDIYEVNLASHEMRRLLVNCRELERAKYSGIQKIDSLGRVWFFTGYPSRFWWYDIQTSTCSERPPTSVLPHLLVDRKKNRVENNSPSDAAVPVPLVQHTTPSRIDTREMFYPLDIFGARRVNIDPNLYIDRSGNAIRCVKGRCASIELGIAHIEVLLPSDLGLSARGLTLRHRFHGDLEVLHAKNGKTIFWVIGKKEFLFFDGAKIRRIIINDENISNADITALTMIPDGTLIGAGYLTNMNLFVLKPLEQRVQEVKSVIPNQQGQINSLTTGKGGEIVGAAYPNVGRFLFDFSAESVRAKGDVMTMSTSDGRKNEQERPLPFGDFMDHSGDYWVASNSEYSDISSGAVWRTTFTNNGVITRLFSGLPRVKAFSQYSDEEVMVATASDGFNSLKFLNKERFEIAGEVRLPKGRITIARCWPSGDDSIFVFNSLRLFRVNRSGKVDGGFFFPTVNRALQSGDFCFLIGKRFVVRRNNKTGQIRLALSAVASFVENEDWVPAAANPITGDLYLGLGPRVGKVSFE